MKIRMWIVSLLCCFMWLTSHASVFHDTDGNSFDESVFKGKWIIINYWASWCDFCLHEVPEFNRFYAHNKDKNLLILSVNYDRLTGDELTAAMKTARINYPVLLEDPASIWKFGFLDAVPVTFVINPKGKIVKKIVGPTTESKLRALIP